MIITLFIMEIQFIYVEKYRKENQEITDESEYIFILVRISW